MYRKESNTAIALHNMGLIWDLNKRKKERSQISKIERRRDPNEYFITGQDLCLIKFVPKRFIYSSLS